ncbi:MAG: MotA/TolQ/ExbB proton channel family protein [Verrucomicrobia bacterium]|nr:MotA/TolQ/ExbB proton channel family protein [Verrucomicrobiota bacterium]
MNLISIFLKGGPIMVPILIVSLLVMATIIERIVFLIRLRRNRSSQSVREIFSNVEHGWPDKAVKIGGQSADYVAGVVTAALRERDTSYTSALLAASSQELKKFNRGLPLLDTAITIAPLLGLLGTVMGMIRSFGLIAGELDAPAAITGGIAEALIATAFGLLVAIMALFPLNYLIARLEVARAELEEAGNRLEILLVRGGARGGE